MYKEEIKKILKEEIKKILKDCLDIKPSSPNHTVFIDYNIAAEDISNRLEKLVMPKKDGQLQKYLIRYKTKDYYSGKEEWQDKQDILELKYEQLDFATIETIIKTILKENYFDSSLKHYHIWDIVLLSA